MTNSKAQRISNLPLLSLLRLGIMIGIWYLISYVYTEFLVPPPHDVVEVLFALATDRSFLLDMALTVAKTLVAVLIGCAIGIPLGLLLGYSRRFYDTFNPVVDFLRSIPIIAAFPIFLLLFGLSDQGRIALAVFSASLLLSILCTESNLQTRQEEGQHRQ